MPHVKAFEPEGRALEEGRDVAVEVTAAGDALPAGVEGALPSSDSGFGSKAVFAEDESAAGFEDPSDLPEGGVGVGQ